MYFITSVNSTDTRCVGYYSDLKIAVQTVENNKGDLYEAGCYPYIVIEKIPEGIYQYDLNPFWYKYNEDSGKYESCERPESEDPCFAGYAIG